MRRMRLLLALLAPRDCSRGADGGGGEEASKPAATRSAGDAETEIRETFEDYNEALVERDYDGACEQLAPETASKLRENVVRGWASRMRRRGARACWR